MFLMFLFWIKETKKYLAIVQNNSQNNISESLYFPTMEADQVLILTYLSLFYSKNLRAVKNYNL